MAISRNARSLFDFPEFAEVVTRLDSIHVTAAASTTPGSRDKLETKGEAIA
jgi:hypothetical protein